MLAILFLNRGNAVRKVRQWKKGHTVNVGKTISMRRVRLKIQENIHLLLVCHNSIICVWCLSDSVASLDSGS